MFYETFAIKYISKYNDAIYSVFFRQTTLIASTKNVKKVEKYNNILIIKTVSFSICDFVGPKSICFSCRYIENKCGCEIT